MRKMLVIDISECTGCEMCTDVCSSRGGKAYSVEGSRIRVLKDEIRSSFIPLICEHCREHPCVDVCPTGAIVYDNESSVFTVNNSACIGCGACAEICPYDGIFINDGVAMKCDLCGGDPACAKVCYPKAIQYVEITDEAIVTDLNQKIGKLKALERDSCE